MTKHICCNRHSCGGTCLCGKKSGSHGERLDLRLFGSNRGETMIQRLTRFLFVFTVLALLCCGAVTHAAVLINEVATAESGGADWVELYNTGPGTQSIENWELFERSSSVKTFPAYTMAVNEYIVVHFNATSADETGSDTNGNGYREFYSADSGLTGTDNVVSIKDNAAAFQDAISYANGDGSWAGAQQTAFDDIVNGGQWTGTAGAGIPTNDTESVSSSGLGAGESLTRSSDSADTNAKADWTLIGAQSPGGATPTALTATIVINEVVFSGDDWTELYCVNDDNGGSGVNLRGCVITDLDSTGLTHQKVLGDSDNDGTADQDCTLKSGEYLLLYYVSDPPPAADETESGADDVVTLYTDAQTGLTGTEEQQVLVDALGNYVDAVCWSNMDGSFTAGEKSSVEDLAGAATPAWIIATPGDAAQSDCVNSSGIPSNYSIGRDASSTDTANSKDEWYWFDTDAASPGAVNPAPAVLTDFTVTAPSYAVSGQTIEVTITARDQNQSTLLSYAGTVDLTSTNGSVTIAPGSSNGFDDGVLSVDVTLTGAGEQTTVQAADSENAGITGTSGTINVVTELPQPVFVINEVVFDGGGGGIDHDWVEIYCKDDGLSGAGINISGYTVRATSEGTIDKTVGDCTVKTGEYIILHYASDGSATDDTTATDGVINIYTTVSGLTGTDDVVVLYNSSSEVLDVVAWVDGDLPAGMITYLTDLNSGGHWGGATPADCFDSTVIGSGDSIARDANSTDTASKDDWTPRSTPTQGANNGDPATVHHFDVDAPAYAVSGTAFSVTLTARNEDNTVMDTYTGTAVLTSTQGAVAITPGSASGFVDGVLTLDVTLTGSTGQTTTIHAEDSGNTGESAQIQIVDTIPSPVLVINEVAFDGGGGGFENDWIEILCLDDGLGGSGFNLAGYTFRPKNATTIDKTIGDCTIKTGEFLLLQYNTEGQTDETQLSGDWIDIYTEDSGLTSSDELVALYTPAEQVVDMVVWANQNGSFSNLSEEYLTTLVTDGHWVKAGDTVAESDCVNSEVVGGKDSIARTLNETTGQPNDTHAVGDWIVTTVPTPGKSNDSGPQPNVGLRITELAPDGGGGGYASDWIEVYCYDDLSSGGGVDISGYSFYIDSKVKTITNGTTVRTGEYILLVFDTEDNDETEASDGLIKIFSDKSGMVTSDDQVVIYDHKDNLIDAVCYTNMDGEPLTQTETDDMTEIIGANGWVGTVDEASCASIADLEEEQSLGRDRSFTDTDTAADWSVFASPTPGKVNALAGEPYALEITPTSRVSTFVGVAVELTVRVVDVFGDVVTSSSLQIDLNTDSSSAEISSDDGFTWSSSDTGYSSGGTLGALFRDSNVGRFTVSATTPGGAVSPAIKEITVLDLPPVVLNELMYNPAEDSGLEYVELYNRSGASVDLTGWKLAVGDSSIEIPDDTTIAAGEHLVLCKELDTFESVYGDATGTWGDYPSENFQAVDTASFSMSNTTDTVGLVSVDNVTKTYVTYLDSWGADGNGMSLEKKDPDALDTNDPEVDVYNWGESDQFFGQGTPGQRNSNYEGAPSTLEMVHVSPGTVFIGEPLVISVKVISNNDIETVRLYYRTAGSGASYTMLTMNRLAGTHLFQVRIPQEDVSLSGIEYYLQATDVDHSVTLPADNPTTSPYTITVEDNTVKVMVVPRKKGVSEGEYFYVDIMIVNARDLVEASFEITYDTTYLDIQDMDKNRDGDQVAVGSLMEAGFNEINLADKGLISFKVTGLDDEVNGDGPLAVIYYKIKNPNEGVPLPSGTYPLHLQNCLVIDKDENEAVPAMFDGDVIIGTGSSELVDTRGGVVSGPWGTQLQVPSGAMKGTFRITIEQMEAGDIPTVDNLNANQYLVPTMVALDIQPHTLVFTRPVTLVFGFDDDAIEALGIDEDNLAIYHWHQDLSAGKALLPKRKNRTRLRPRRGQRSVRFFGSPGSGRTSKLQGAGDTYWERIGGEVAKGDNTVTAMVDRPGVYMLVGDTDPGGQMSIYDVKVSPNPFRPTDGSLKPETYLTFRMSNNAEELWVRIYDVKGRLVKTLADDVSDVSRGLVQYTWNGTDDAGSTVSTGIYVMSIYAEDEFVRLAKAETTVIVSKNMYE